MNFVKAVWRLGLCAFFVIVLTYYGLSAHATEPEGAEKALHEGHETALDETHETIEQGKHETDETMGDAEGKRKIHGKPGGEEPNGDDR